MIGRITERRELERLTHHGRRARTPHLWCRYLDEPGTVPPRVAFAISRTVGTAVTRNRLRRRLRELLRCAVTTQRLPFGQLLVGARPGAGELSFAELDDEVGGLLSTVRPAPRPST